MAAIDPAELRALARKYTALHGLRQRKDGGDDGAALAKLRALAREFPGCLRELDTLGVEELGRRARATRRAIKVASAREPWMAWIAGYHRLMRATLALKRTLRRQSPSPAVARRLAREASREAGATVEPGFVVAIARPPGGRLGPMVLRAIGRRFDVPPTDVAAALFPVRRPSPYRLD